MKNARFIIVFSISAVLLGIFSIIVYRIAINNLQNTEPREYLSFPEGIRYENKTGYDDFINTKEFKEVNVTIRRIFKNIKIQKTETDPKKIDGIKTFIAEANDPYIREAGTYDNSISVDFIEKNKPMYRVEIYKNDDKDICYFIFYKLGVRDSGTFFSCFDKKGFIDNYVDEYLK